LAKRRNKAIAPYDHQDVEAGFFPADWAADVGQLGEFGEGT